MKVALIGGTGFVGSYLVDELIDQGHKPVLLVREGSEGKINHPDSCDRISGSVAVMQAIRVTLNGTDAVIYNIGILREFPDRGITFEELHFQSAKRVIDAAQALEIKRFLLMSANGVKEDGTPYQATKYRAEEYLRQADLDWTIFRPSVIFGDPRGRMEFCTELRDQLIDSPLPAPLFYEGVLPWAAGQFRMSPIHVKDVAKVFVNALRLPNTLRQIYHLGGPDGLTWKEIIETIAKATGKTKWMLPAPALLVRGVAGLFDRFEFFPITRDQLTMLLEGNVCDSKAVFETFGIEPIHFDSLALFYLRGE